MSGHPAVEFLRQAHAHAEELARAATPGPWEVRPPGDHGDGWEVCGRGPGHNERRWVVGAESGGGVYDEADAQFMVATDPAAVLRRVAAERQILGLHAADDGECRVCAGEFEAGGSAFLGNVPWPCRTVLLLVQAWGWTEGV